ncbi:1-pyrroline-5-carboxylate dehydrogenase [Vibrio sp. JC009]|uniref:1-pyrroline-5-carboxylate dehydrogenase n=1 Tax=Vibrio sp. JC009 TaxID=2912314 RepID=UPI0023B11862|nr:1-pyrroline-5-carboxylate dehydrogenase [Vibrio sp. JC009]WED22876.1 1-pyrroline-5-carboxylate dehydrogenase [Vibrio sp. JC009]
MSQHHISFNQALNAFEKWNLTESEKRCEVLNQLFSPYPDDLKAVFRYQLNHAGKIAAKTEFLNGPTGETNELYTQGRGVALLLVDSDENNALKAVVSMLVSLMITGNSVIVCSDKEAINSFTSNLSGNPIMPENLLQQRNYAASEQLIGEDIRSLVYIGNNGKAGKLNRALADSVHAITALISETDLARLPNSRDPMLALHFITERVRTINIAAIGGNAKLLELGADRS